MPHANDTAPGVHLPKTSRDYFAGGPPERRASPRLLCEVRVIYRPIACPDGSAPGCAVAMNLSAGGVGLLTGVPLLPGTVLALRPRGAAACEVRSLVACVVHSGQLPAGGWVHGCAFSRRLTAHELDALIA
jgi:hypothetical protein